MERCMRILLALAFPLLAGCLPTQDSSNLPKTGTFTQLASMNTARADHASEVVNGHIYVIGGVQLNNVGGYPDSVEQYDPTSNAWTTVANMTSGRQGMASATLGNSIYIFGGYDATHESGLSVAEAYDTSTNTWFTLSAMPLPAEYASARTVGSLIYVFTGAYNGYASTAKAYSYNPASDTWTGLASYPGHSTNGAEPVIMGTQIYFVGRDPVIIYDTVSNTWSQMNGVTAFNDSNGGQAVALLNNSIYAFDVYANTGAQTAGLEVYRTSPALLSQLYYSPFQLTLSRVVVLNNMAFISGGSDLQGNVSANFYRFSP